MQYPADEDFAEDELLTILERLAEATLTVEAQAAFLAGLASHLDQACLFGMYHHHCSI